MRLEAQMPRGSTGQDYYSLPHRSADRPMPLLHAGDSWYSQRLPPQITPPRTASRSMSGSAALRQLRPTSAPNRVNKVPRHERLWRLCSTDGAPFHRQSDGDACVEDLSGTLCWSARLTGMSALDTVMFLAQRPHWALICMPSLTVIGQDQFGRMRYIP